MPPRLARLVAIIAAVALVGGAFVLRGVLAGDDDTVATGSGGGDGGEVPAEGYRVICDEDLGDAACAAIKALDGVDEATFTTLNAVEAVAAMSAAEVPYDAWVTLDPWPQILDETRVLADLGPVAEGEGVPVASSALALLTYGDRGIPCPAPATWACLADAAGDSDLGLPDLDSATGPLVLGAAAVGLLGPDFGIADAREGAARTQLGALVDGAGPGDLAAQADRIVVQQGSFDGLVTTHGAGARAARTTRGQGQGLVVADLAPVDPGDVTATLGVVLAPIGPAGTGAADRLGDQITEQTVTDALDDAGWDGPPGPSTGLPEADLLYALREDAA